MAWPERFAIAAFIASLTLYGAYVVLAIVTDPGEPLTAGDWRNVALVVGKEVGGLAENRTRVRGFAVDIILYIDLLIPIS